MRFVHRIAVSSSVETVWDFLWQAERVGACLPGCRSVRTVEPFERYQATIEERVGPFKARFDWEIAVDAREPFKQIRVTARGKDNALAATGRAQLAVRLDAREQGGTMLEVETDLQVAGKIATLGQVVIKRKADQVVRDFAEALRAQLESAAPRAERA